MRLALRHPLAGISNNHVLAGVVTVQHLLNEQAQRHQRGIQSIPPEAHLLLHRARQFLRRQDVEQLLATRLQKTASQPLNRFLHSPIPDSILQRLILQW